MSWLKAGDVVVPTHPDKLYKKALYRDTEEMEVVRTCEHAFSFPLSDYCSLGTHLSNRVKRISRAPVTPVEGVTLDDDGA